MSKLKTDNPMEEYARIAAQISSSIVGLIDAQEYLVELMCKNCDLPAEVGQALTKAMYQQIEENKWTHKNT